MQLEIPDILSSVALVVHPGDMTMKRALLLFALGVPLLPSGTRAQDPNLVPALQISSALPEFTFLDQRFAAAERDCGGQNMSPPIAWSGEPATTKSFAVMDFDPDGANGQGVAHWIGYNIPPTEHSLPEGGMSHNLLKATVGTNSHGTTEYYGACPPFGKRHHYVYEVYALDLPVGALTPGMKREEFLAAIKGHTVANQSIVFVYQRKPPAKATTVN
jgi:Raf kinase inhibitor-like YbhB/YbcL family protein